METEEVSESGVHKVPRRGSGSQKDALHPLLPTGELPSYYGEHSQLSHYPRRIRRTILILTVACVITIGSVLIWNAHPKQKAIVTKTGGGPYGFTVYRNFRQQTVDLLQQLHVDQIRYQLNWSEIEPQPSQYDWSRLDAAVALANAYNIHITFPIQNAPDWARNQVCAGRRLLSDATQMALFAQTVAQRYDGQNGYGSIDSYEVGNEEFDSLWTGDWNQSIACRVPKFVGPVLQAAYQAIKGASPKATVGMNALWWTNTQHVEDYMTWLYQNGYGTYFDYANFHYYICNGDPLQGIPYHPSFPQEWQAIHHVMAKYNDGDKPISVTEIGWNTTADQQDPSCVVTPQQPVTVFA